MFLVREASVVLAVDLLRWSYLSLGRSYICLVPQVVNVWVMPLEHPDCADENCRNPSRWCPVMSNTKSAATNKVVPLHPPKTTQSTSEKKWGKAVIALGFCIVPSLLLRAQQRLGLNPTQLAVLMQLCDFWWESDRKPYPSKAKLSERLGLSPRQIRHIADLEAAGLVQRIEQRGDDGGKRTNLYDLSGLVDRLQDFEPEFRRVEEDARAARRAVGRRGYRLTQAERLSP